MPGYSIIVSILGIAIAVNIFWRIRNEQNYGLQLRIPELLMSSYLLCGGALSILQSAANLPMSGIKYSALILIFLPAAVVLSKFDFEKDENYTHLWIWLGISLILATSCILDNEKNAGSSFGSASNAIVVLFLGMALFNFGGFSKFLIGLAAVVWGAYLADLPYIDILGISIFAGIATFTSTINLIHKEAIPGINFNLADFFNSDSHPFLILDTSGKIVFANAPFLRMSGYKKEDVLGKEAVEYFDIPSNWRLNSQGDGKSRKVRCHLLLNGGERLAVGVTIDEIRRPGKPPKNLLCSISNEQELEALDIKLKSESARLTSLHETSLALTSSLELAEVLRSISRAAEAMTNSDNCIIFALDHSRQVLKPIYSTEEVFSSEVMKFELAVGDGLTGRVVQLGQAMIQNYDGALNVAQQIPGTSEQNDESLLSIPLVARDIVIGALTMYKKERRKFEEDDLRILTIFAAQASAIIETSRLYMKLRESEKIYRNSVDQSDDAIFFVDFETGKIKDANETACALFKYTKSELVSFAIWELQPEKEMHTARDVWQKARKAGRFFLNEISAKTRDNEIIPMSVIATAIVTGETSFIQWVARDISAFRKVLEKAGLFYQIFERLDEPVLITDIRGKLLYSNASFREVFRSESTVMNVGGIASLGMQTPLGIILESCWAKVKNSEYLVEEVNLSNDISKTMRKMISILPQRNENDQVTCHVWLFGPAPEMASVRVLPSEIDGAVGYFNSEAEGPAEEPLDPVAIERKQ